jgi:small-conductance mechanosensitive channel
MMTMNVKKNREIRNISTPSDTGHKLLVGSYVLLALGCVVLYFLLQLQVFGRFGSYTSLLKKLLLAGAVSFIVLIVSRIAERLVNTKTHVKSVRYNLIRAIRLLSILVIIGVFVSFLFKNWYTAAVSLGLISLILGFALQTPISSFIGWLYIIFRAPYRIGDRIQIDTFTGDVVEVNYLDTTLWEFAGDYLTSDMPSGRLIRFPNSLVFASAVYNYSWDKFPYIWNEIPFHIAYESDLNFVETTLRETAKKELGPEMAEHIDELKELVKQTPVDELEIREYPYVSFRTNANTWLEAIVTYLVAPKQATIVRSRILKAVVAALLREPDKVMFPKSNNR